MQRRIIGIVLVGTLLAACGGGGNGDDGAAQDGDASSAPPSSAMITMRDNEFVPADATIAAGEVELVNEGESPHTFTIEGEDVDVEVEPGATATASVDLAAGSYTVFCEFHRGQGMEGTLTVS